LAYKKKATEIYVLECVHPANYSKLAQHSNSWT